MADKTTTLKTKTNDNVYPNVIGENRKDAFADSSTIKHHFYDQTHKVGFQIANETNIKIQNSLQKPAGLTKTELVGVGTNGQENIEIGDNLTLANGKLSASGGGSGMKINIIDVTINNQTETDYGYVMYITLNSDIDPNKINILNLEGSYEIITNVNANDTDIRGYFYNIGHESIILYGEIMGRDGSVIRSYYGLPVHYSHFITLTSSTLGSINFNYDSLNGDILTIDTLKDFLEGKSVTCSGYIDDGGTKEIAQYIEGKTGVLTIGWFDLSDGSTGGTIVDNTFSISDKPTPIIY